MPRNYDLSRRRAQINNNPNVVISPTGIQSIIRQTVDIPEIALEAIEQMVTNFLTDLKQITGLDLLPFWDTVKGSLNSLIQLFGELNPLSGSFDPVAAVLTFFNLVASAAAEFPTVLVNDLVALWGGAASALPQEIIDTILNALGIGGTGNLVTALTSPVENLLGGSSPLNALNLIGQIPQELLGLIPISSITGASPNLLTNGLFDGANSLSGQSIWSWVGTIFPTGTTATTPGSASVTASGVQQTLLANVVPVSAGQTVGATVQVLFQNLVGSGSPIQLILQTFSDLLGQNLVGTQVLGSVGSSGGGTPSDWSGAPTGSKSTTLNGTYTVPSSGVGSASVGLQVSSSATSGTVWFGNATQQFTGLMPNSLVQGIQGISDIGTVVQNTWDNFATTIADVLGLGGVLSSDNTLSKVTMAVQGHASTTSDAHSLATSATDTLNIVNNKPAPAGLEATVESNMSLQSLGSAAAPTSVTSTQSASAGSWVRLGQAKTLGFVQWIGYATGTITNFYLNFAKMDSSGNWVALFSSADLHTLLNTSWGWQLYDFPSGVAVNPGDVIAVGFQVVGSGTYNLAGAAQSWLTSHPSAATAKTGFTRNTGSSGPTTLSVSAASISWTGNAPYIGFGVGTADIPPPVHAAETTEYTTNAWRTGGTYTWTAPSWFRTGVDYIDVIALGGGGGGSSGTGGVGGGGSASVVTFGTTTLTAAGGAAGPSSGLTTGGAAILGHGPGNETYLSTTYYGGPDVNPTVGGGQPGGGGGGGTFSYGFGAEYGTGGFGGSWATGTYQPTTTTVSVTVGAGGPGQSNYGAGPGADGAVWIVARQNA